MTKYRKKPLEVDARRIESSEMVSTAHGRVRAEAGDWILTNPETNDTWPIKPDIFDLTYERVEGPVSEPCESPPLGRAIGEGPPGKFI